MWVCVYLFAPLALRSDASFTAAATAFTALGLPPAIARLIHIPSILGNHLNLIFVYAIAKSNYTFARSFLNFAIAFTLGCIQLILLFQGSMTFSESICLSK
jgi:hypothetical protein